MSVFCLKLSAKISATTKNKFVEFTRLDGFLAELQRILTFSTVVQSTELLGRSRHIVLKWTTGDYSSENLYMQNLSNLTNSVTKFNSENHD